MSSLGLHQPLPCPVCRAFHGRDSCCVNKVGEARPQETKEIEDVGERTAGDLGESSKNIPEVDPDWFYVLILPHMDKFPSELAFAYSRLNPRLTLVEQAAKKLAANMLKGVLKHPGDVEDVGVDDWIESLLDDLTDSLNYIYLLKEAMDVQKATYRCPVCGAQRFIGGPHRHEEH